MGFVLADEVVQAVDAVLGKGRDAVRVVGIVDPDQAVFGFHADGDVAEPVLVDFELTGNQRQGGDG